MSRIGVLTGLAREAAVLERAGGRDTPFDVAVSAMDPARGRTAAERLAAARPDVLVSFGLAGGLVPHRQAGDLVLPRAVVTPAGQRWPVDGAWWSAFGAALRNAREEAAVVSVDAPVATPAAKRDLAVRTGAPIVDMESAALAAVAERAGVPMIVVRAVCDPVGRRVPPALHRLTDDRGRLRPARLPSLVPHLPSVIGLSRESGRAMRALHQAAAILAQLDAARGRPATS